MNWFWISYLIAWLGVGAFATRLGHDDLRRRFPHKKHEDLWLGYLTALLGPINLFCVWLVFFSGMNPREPRS